MSCAVKIFCSGSSVSQADIFIRCTTFIEMMLLLWWWSWWWWWWWCCCCFACFRWTDDMFAGHVDRRAVSVGWQVVHDIVGWTVLGIALHSSASAQPLRSRAGTCHLTGITNSYPLYRCQYSTLLRPYRALIVFAVFISVSLVKSWRKKTATICCAPEKEKPSKTCNFIASSTAESCNNYAADKSFLISTDSG